MTDTGTVRRTALHGNAGRPAGGWKWWWTSATTTCHTTQVGFPSAALMQGTTAPTWCQRHRMESQRRSTQIRQFGVPGAQHARALFTGVPREHAATHSHGASLGDKGYCLPPLVTLLLFRPRPVPAFNPAVNRRCCILAEAVLASIRSARSSWHTGCCVARKVQEERSACAARVAHWVIVGLAHLNKWAWGASKIAMIAIGCMPVPVLDVSMQSHYYATCYRGHASVRVDIHGDHATMSRLQGEAALLDAFQLLTASSFGDEVQYLIKQQELVNA